jgi:hypothetical protein
LKQTVADFEFCGIMLGGARARAWAMPIRQYLGDDRAFGPEDLDAMGKAFSAALNKLGLSTNKDSMAEMVARRIVRAALAGERDPIRLAEIGAGGRE